MSQAQAKLLAPAAAPRTFAVVEAKRRAVATADIIICAAPRCEKSVSNFHQLEL